LKNSEEQMLIRYLLGDVSEAEQTQIEDRLFADNEFHEQLLALKSELADDYVRGALSATERARFANRFLHSAAGRQRVAFARAMNEALPDASPATAPVIVAATSSWWHSLAGFLRVPALQFAFATAAILLAVGSFWLYRERTRLHSELDIARAAQLRQQQQQQDAQRQLDEQRTRGAQLAAELEREKAERARLENERTKLPQPSASAPLSFLSFTLLPGVSRAGGGPETLAIPHLIARVNLQLQLAGDERFLQYRVELRTLRGQLILRQSRLQARGQAVTVSVPAQRLAAGEYELTLQAPASPGQFTDVGFYYIHVVKK
jgi:anti-sigma factor RsiW